MWSNTDADLLKLAGVPAELHAHALACIAVGDVRSDGLLWAKLKVRYLRAGKIADALPWEANRLIDVRPDASDDDVEPMLNIGCNGDKVPWDGQGPVTTYWLDKDPASAEYQFAVSQCYYAKGQHPRSRAARKAWYRRNGGAFRAYRLGLPADLQDTTRWDGASGSVSVTVYKSGQAWLIDAYTKLLGKLYLRRRVGYEIDNITKGPGTPQLWYPLPGYELRAPLTWSVLPKWGGLTE